VGRPLDPDQPAVVQELEAAPFPCLEPAAPGPSGYRWCRVADSPAEVSWVTPLSADEAHVSIDSPASAWAGVAFELDPRLASVTSASSTSWRST